MIVCQNTVVARTLCAIEFAPGSYAVHGATFTAHYQLLRHGRVAAHGTLIARHGRITRASTGRLRQGAYTLVVSTGAGRARRVLLRIIVHVR